LVDSNCVQSVQCNSRQFFYQGTCIQVPSECTTFSSVDGSCTSCKSGYNLNSGICLQAQVSVISLNNCASPCQTCHFANPKYCFSCIPYWTLSNASYGTCLPVSN
jgi:hypothetical protein